MFSASLTQLEKYGDWKAKNHLFIESLFHIYLNEFDLTFTVSIMSNAASIRNENQKWLAETIMNFSAFIFVKQHEVPIYLERNPIKQIADFS